MRKKTFDKACRGHALATALGKTVLALVVLVSVTGAGTIESGGPFAYITNSASNNVSVIDTATNTITAIVNVGRSVAFGQFIVPPLTQPDSCSRLQY